MRFECEIKAVKSRADFTFDVVLNMPEYQLAETQAMMAAIGDMLVVESARIMGAKDGR